MMRYIIPISCSLLIAGCQPDESTSRTALVQQSSPVTENYIVLTVPPEPLLDKMALLYSPDNAEWSKLVNEFVENGHPILPYVIRQLQKDQKLSPALAKQITERIDQSPAVNLDAQRILSLMETACYADVMCHRIEYPLRVATLDYVKLNIDSQETKDALHWIRDSYRSGLPLDWPGDETGDFRGLIVKGMRERLVVYANQILGSIDSEQ